MVWAYAGSDGCYYTDWQVATQMESGEWVPCMWEEEEGWELVVADDELVWLIPVERSALPNWVDVRETSEGYGTKIVDTRT